MATSSGDVVVCGPVTLPLPSLPANYGVNLDTSSDFFFAGLFEDVSVGAK